MLQYGQIPCQAKQHNILFNNGLGPSSINNYTAYRETNKTMQHPNQESICGKCTISLPRKHCHMAGASQSYSQLIKTKGYMDIDF